MKDLKKEIDRLNKTLSSLDTVLGNAKKDTEKFIKICDECSVVPKRNVVVSLIENCGQLNDSVDFNFDYVHSLYSDGDDSEKDSLIEILSRLCDIRDMIDDIKCKLKLVTNDD